FCIRSRRRHTRFSRDWSSDVCSSDLRLRDVARIELGAQEYGTNGYRGDKPAAVMAVTQLPGSNALETAKAVRSELAEAAKSFPRSGERRVGRGGKAGGGREQIGAGLL